MSPDPNWTHDRLEWEGRRSTSRLFGCYVTATRESRLLPIDALADSSGVTQEWLRSLERGEFIPTPLMVDSLNEGFSLALTKRPPADPEGIDLRLRDVFLELSSAPHGELAAALCRRFGSVAATDDWDQESALPDGVLPVSAGLSLADRLLVVFPIALILATSLALLRMWAWARGWRDVPEVDLPSAVLAGTGLLAITAVTVPSARQLLRRASQLVRTNEARKKARTFETQRRQHEFASSDGTTWYHPALGPHLIPRYRDDYENLSMAADFAERVCLGTFCLALLGGLMSLALAWPAPGRQYTMDTATIGPRSAMYVVTAALLGMAVLSRRSAARLALRAHGTFADAVGQRRSQKSKDDQRALEGIASVSGN